LPVVGVSVSLIDAFDPLHDRPESSGKRLDLQKTDEKGEFTFAVHPGSYRIHVAASGTSRYVSHTVSDITVAANTTCSIALTTGLVVSGRVLTSEGKPLASGSVIAVGFESSTYTTACPVFSDGTYDLVVPKGKYYLAFRSDSDTSQRQVDSTGTNGNAVPVLAGNVAALVVEADLSYDIVLPRLFELTGQVSDTNGRPVFGAVTTVVPAESGQSLPLGRFGLTGLSQTDSEGKFQFHLQAGFYDLGIEPDRVSELSGLRQNRFEIKEDCSKEFTLRQGCALSGEVVCGDKRLSDCLVRIVDTDQNRELLTKTDTSGRFMISVPEGDYRVLVTAHPKDSPTKTINGVDYAGLAPASCVVSVAGDKNTTFDLQEGTAFYGSVADDAGCPRPGVRLSVFTEDDLAMVGNNLTRALSNGITDGAGNYCFFLSSGTYWLVVHRDFVNAKKVEVGTEPLKLDIDWQGWCQLSLEVVGEDGAKIAHCRLRYRPYRVDHVPTAASQAVLNDRSSDYTWLTGDEGICRLTLPVGIYTFEFLPPKDSAYEGRVLRQLSVSTDLTKKVVLPLKGLSAAPADENRPAVS
jgi:hypothetical protein